MRYLTVLMLALLVLLQYELWIAPGGALAIWHLQQKISQQIAANENLQDNNAVLLAEINDLKTAGFAVEERARDDLGMIKKDEVFYQIADSSK